MKPSESFEVLLWLRLKTSLIVRSGGAASNDPDAVHLNENNRAVLPGTAITGALRQRCMRIVNTMKPEKAGMVSAMFGPAKEPGKQESLRASRVSVDEVELHDGYLAVQTRVAIDRFSQASLETALFDEAPFWPKPTVEGHVRGLRIVLEPPRSTETATARAEAEASLLLMAIKDLWLADLPLGGEAAAGRGVFQGVRAKITQPGLGVLEMKTLDEKDPAKVEWAGDWTKVNEWCAKWLN